VEAGIEPPRKKHGHHFLVLGYLLLFLSLLCLIGFFNRDGYNAPEFLRNRGSETLLLAVFTAICGVYVLAQRRFSLSGLLVAAIVAGAASTGVRCFDVPDETEEILFSGPAGGSHEVAAAIKAASDRLQRLTFDFGTNFQLPGFSSMTMELIVVQGNDFITIRLKQPGRKNWNARTFCSQYLHHITRAYASQQSGTASNVPELSGLVANNLYYDENPTLWLKTAIPQLRWLRDHEEDLVVKSYFDKCLLLIQSNPTPSPIW
jgi:hypothetical protein